ncbi:lysylphosphatidylglycerol synthase transmembrane domain-containing protein [Methylobacter sp.]|uniref:lysylphosphatidylglycerol synthase transmembrane domain-containing protein n=1 Tax=Methylobacter sp. TaxID=2051955 RepID=UPI002FDE4D12
MSWLKALPLLLWLAALILVGWILGQLPLATIVQSITKLSLEQWLAWIALNLGIILLATERWRVLTNILHVPVRFGELLIIRQAGQTVSFITPGPQFGGEPLQIYWLCQRNRLPIHCALLALGLDRFYELWVNFGVLLIGVLLLLVSPIAEVVDSQEISLVLLLILLTLSLFGWLILKQPERVFGWIKRVARHWQHHPRLQNIETHWQRLGSDVKRIMEERKPALLRAFILSIVGWVGLIGELWLLLSFFDLELDGYAFLVIVVSMRLAFLLPLPGGIGTLEATMFWAFQFLSLPTTGAMGLIALMRLRDALVLMAGLWCLRIMQTRG